MNEKIIRKPRHVLLVTKAGTGLPTRGHRIDAFALIDPEALHKARIESLCSKKTVGEWLEDAIEEKVAREEREEKG